MLSASCQAWVASQSDEEFMGQRDADDLLGLSGLVQPSVEGCEVGLVPADDFGDDEEHGPDAGASAADGAFPGPPTAVVGDGREPGELGHGLVGQGADLRHLGHEVGDGAVGHALDRAEAAIERGPGRVLGDGLGDRRLQHADLRGDHRQDGGDGGDHLRLGDEAGLVDLPDLQRRELAQAHHQGGQPGLGRGGRRGRADPLGLRVPGDDPAIDPVGLLQDAHAFGEAARRAG